MSIDGAAEPRSPLDPLLGLPPPPPGAPSRHESRGSLVLRRVVARAIDWTVVTLLVIVGWLVATIFAVGPALWSALLGTGETPEGGLGQAMVVVSFAVPFLWEFAWLAAVGSTPGKRVLRLRVISEPDLSGSPTPTRRLPMAAAASRSLIGFYIGLGFVNSADGFRTALIAVYLISMAASKNHRSLLDLLARTRVVHQPPR